MKSATKQNKPEAPNSHADSPVVVCTLVHICTQTQNPAHIFNSNGQVSLRKRDKERGNTIRWLVEELRDREQQSERGFSLSPLSPLKIRLLNCLGKLKSPHRHMIFTHTDTLRYRLPRLP